MPRKKRSEPQRPVRALYPPTTIEQDTRHLPARANVLGTVELLERIFSHLSQTDLILNIQGVCHLWKDIIANIPETYLNKVPPVAPGRNPAQQFNPLLFKHFRALYGVTREPARHNRTPRTAKLNVSEYCARAGRTYFDNSNYYKIGCFAGCEHHVHGMSISITAEDTAEHRKFTRANASWRRMQLASPPITKVRRQERYSEEYQMVTVPEGVRMGQLYDLIVYGGLVGNKKEDRVGMDIEWTSRPRRSRKQADEELRRLMDSYLDDIDAYGLEESPDYYSLDEDDSDDSDDDNKRLPKVAVDEIHITRRYLRLYPADVRMHSLAHVAGRRLLCSGIQERELILKP